MELAKLVILYMIVSFLGGIVIGFNIGGKIVNDNWGSYVDKQTAWYDRYCICSRTIGEPKELDFNLTSIITIAATTENPND